MDPFYLSFFSPIACEDSKKNLERENNKKIKIVKKIKNKKKIIVGVEEEAEERFRKWVFCA